MPVWHTIDPRMLWTGQAGASAAKVEGSNLSLWCEVHSLDEVGYLKSMAQSCVIPCRSCTEATGEDFYIV